MKDSHIRKKFKEYFKSSGHKWYDSIPLVPPGDESILFTTAGMVQFKDKFLSDPGDVTRAASIQKCFRTSDVEEVGKTSRHLTFFEMYGNFSFGDYFKKEAIKFGWDFLSRVIGLDEEKLYATVYKDDSEAHSIWKQHLPEEKIYRLGEKDNFWKMGETGPCGPCSEILYDQGPQAGCTSDQCRPGCDCDRYVEIWNLVFTQYERLQNGKLVELPRKNIDTGMGLERLHQVVNGLENVFQTETLKPLFDKAREDFPRCSEKSARIIADHARAAALLISDGISPSNEGRGYVLRKLIRRASREGQKAGWEKPRLWEYTAVVVDLMGGYYNGLIKKANHIAAVCKAEEQNFIETLERASSKLRLFINEMASKGEKILSARKSFKLYDTYGLPPDITSTILKERGMKMDRKGFDKLLKKSAQKSHWQQSEDSLSYIKELEGVSPTEFTGYDQYQSEGKVVKVLAEGKALVTDRTPLYACSGGQIGDKGLIESKNGRFKVENTVKSAGVTVHEGTLEGNIKKGEKVKVSVDLGARKSTERNHTATHLLQAALREIVGKHIHQDGSLVEPEGFRFDFTHNNELSKNELDVIEEKVNNMIMENYSVRAKEMTKQQAEERGALAFFQEKYGDRVRSVVISDHSGAKVSMELCGGTHVSDTGQIGLFKIISEKGIAAGVRRIQASTGKGALKYVKKHQGFLMEAARELKTSPSEIINSITKMKKEIDDLKDKINSLENKLITAADTTKEEDIKDITFAVKDFGAASEGVMRAWLDSQTSSKAAAALATSTEENSVKLILKISRDLNENLNAADILKKAVKAVGGGAGGRKDMARGGGTDPGSLKKAVEIVKKEIEKKLN